jgi:hypothetical protein
MRESDHDVSKGGQERGQMATKFLHRVRLGFPNTLRSRFLQPRKSVNLFALNNGTNFLGQGFVQDAFQIVQALQMREAIG